MASFAQVYAFYLSQHTERTCRRLHFAATTIGLAAALQRKDMLTGKIPF